MKKRMELHTLRIKCYFMLSPKIVLTLLRSIPSILVLPVAFKQLRLKHLSPAMKVNSSWLPGLCSWWLLCCSSCFSLMSNRRASTSWPCLGVVTHLKHSPRGHFTMLSELLNSHHKSSAKANAQREP